MGRDEFPAQVKRLLAERVGFKCSNPECRQPTSGPQADPSASVNVGVAAHITGASPGGPRYDPDLTPEARASADNGIWLCQNHGKLVDNDTGTYTVAGLREWKQFAEDWARRDLLRPPESRGTEDAQLLKAESLLPELLSEMRKDLQENPLAREFVALRRAWAYNDTRQILVYYYDDHEGLDDQLHILVGLDLIEEITHNNTKRFLLTERLVEHLTK